LKILMISWEYPPRIVGGISRAVDGLSKALTKKGDEVHVVTNEFPSALSEEDVEGVQIHRVPVEITAPNFHSWIMLMNHFFTKRIAQLAKEHRFEIIHVHDWLTTPSGVEAKHFLDASLVTTLHSLESGRSGGLNSVESRMVDNVEWWSTYEAAIVIVCSVSMKGEVVKNFATPETKVWVIPNGVDPTKFATNVDKSWVRSRYNISDGDILALFVGRLTSQKGCEYLIRAMTKVEPHVKLIVVGDGWMRNNLQSEAAASGQSWRIRFTGFLPDNEVVSLMKAADVLVIPSIYEPFGVVALEGMAAGVPVIGSDIDGLAEVIQHEYNGILVHAKDSNSIAWGIHRVLTDSDGSIRLAHNAAGDIRERFSWDAVANLTQEAYKKALA
jgi:glycogen(starch) synthase